ncbi:5-formyltetrahydrofolate cyclo-ligase [Hyphomonas sp. FCG-A18]|uniref:5-formyltetrahydrofolate cyclo-ligase n=1 Tax=Hyphomonas sp. FCG-A18 TaxID=3080019 RepID=UPI002B29C321|nr:5-formyltetrahydrofolate cyclo-ligase [Hyphomonas sp. FCG-A18]
MSEDKQALRDQMKALREELAARDPDAGEILADKFPLKLLERYGPTVAVYLPIGSEMDPRPLMDKLVKAGAKLALPCVLDDGSMIYRHYTRGDPLEKRAFGLLEPFHEVPEVQPTLILTPLLAFDRQGNRLGYGKGHYDRAIARLRQQGRVFICGLAFHGQEVDAIPAEQHDIPLDWVMTERGSIPLFMMRAMGAQEED